MKMKLKNLVTVAALMSVGFAANACGKKNDDGNGSGNGDGGANSGTVDSRVTELEKEIDALKALLDKATEDEIPGLLEQLADAEDRLAELENCANTGNCEGLETVAGLNALTDAYCDWVFGCCSDDEVRATLGAAAGDAAGCKDMYTDVLARGNTSPYLPGYTMPLLGLGGGSLEMATLAEMLQKGRVSLDAAAVEACAELTRTQACGDADPVAPAECGEGAAPSACSDILVGQQGLSEPCSWPQECEEGLTCITLSTVVIEGVCMPVAQADDFCQTESDCVSADGNLYCDEDDGTCKVRPTGDEDCVFADPTFNSLPTTVQVVPCEPGFFCSPETSTCVAECDALGNGDLCSDSAQCGDSRYCDFLDVAVDEMSQVGVCKSKLAAGATTTTSAACVSGSTYINVSTRCDGVGGDDCNYATFIGTDCNSGSCVEATDVCRTKCGAQYDCGSDETCVGGVCYEHVGSNDDCLVNEQCPAAQFCDAGTCAAKGGSGDPCATADECESGFACVNAECRPFGGLSTGGFCYDWFHCTSERCNLVDNTCINGASLLEEGDDCDMDAIPASNINEDPCGAGLFCKRSEPNSATDFSGTCSAQLAPGAACDRSINPSVNQCVGNQTCVTNNQTGKFSCRVTYTTPDQHEACVLPVFRVQDAYGNSGNY